jgi:hypothetical protein
VLPGGIGIEVKDGFITHTTGTSVTLAVNLIGTRYASGDVDGTDVTRAAQHVVAGGEAEPGYDASAHGAVWIH